MADFTIQAFATIALLVVGALFMLLAAVGVLRMPDVFTRMQATSKAATLGVGCVMLAVVVHFGELAVTTRAAAVVLFTFLTAPIGAHMIGRAAYVAKTPLWERTTRDDLDGRYGDAGPLADKAGGNGLHGPGRGRAGGEPA